MKFALFLLLLVPCHAISAEDTLGEWLSANQPRVRTYLNGLTKQQVGAKLTGVDLSDGSTQLNNSFRYLANLSDLSRGLHAYKFSYEYEGASYEVHYLWLDRGVKELSLSKFPECNGKWIEPGGFAVLSGDQYTYSSLFPSEDIVVTTCLLRTPNTLSGAAQPK
jgi:hypothetical protein